jgi:hypothetical protein
VAEAEAEAAYAEALRLRPESAEYQPALEESQRKRLP